LIYKNKNSLIKIIKNYFPGLQTCNDNLREILLKYLLFIIDFTKDEFLNLVESCLPKDEGVAMTLAERLEKKGFEKGQKQGLEKGLEQGLKEVVRRMLLSDKSLNFIQEVSGLSLRAIAKTRQEMTH